MRKLMTLLFVCLAILPVVAAAQSVEAVRLKAALSSSHEPSPVAGNGGMADVVVEFILQKSATGDLTSARADFRVQYALNDAETLTNMHVHVGAEGVPGGVVVGSNFGAAVSAGPGAGALFRSLEVTDAAGLGAVMAIIEHPSDYYVNSHSSSNPGGIMRGQLTPENPAIDAVTALSAKIDAVKADTAEIANLKDMIRKLGQVLGLRL